MGLSFYLSFGKFVAFNSNHYSVPFQPSVAFKCPHSLPIVFFFVFYFTGVCVCVCTRAHPYSKARRSFSPCHASPRDRTQVVRHGSKCPSNTIIYIIHSFDLILAFLKLWMTNCIISHFQNTVENFCLSLLKHSFCKNIQLCFITSFHCFRSVPRKA